MRFAILLILLFVVSFPVRVAGQEGHPLSASLLGWEHQNRMTLLDRSGSRDGLVTDRGVFLRFTPEMDHEHDLNRFTYDFTPSEDYTFFRSPNGFRTSMGNLSAADLAYQSHIRSDIELSEGHRLGIDGVSEQNYQANRAFFELDYRYNLWENHHIGVHHTLGGFRPGHDAGAFYRIGSPQEGLMELEFTYRDYLNNYIFEPEGTTSAFADSTREYEGRPGMLSGTFVTPDMGGFRAEAVFGAAFETEAEIRSSSVPQEGFIQKERAHYFGGLVEYSGNRAALGLIYKRRFSEMERDTLDQAESGIRRAQYESRQVENKTGAYLIIGSQEITWETHAWWESYSDRQQGEFYDYSDVDSLNYEEDRVLLRNRIQYQPRYRGLTGGAEVLLDFREPRSDTETMESYSPSIHDLNARVTAFAGYRFHPRMSVITGFGFDVDGDFHENPEGDRDDNAFLRLELRW